MVAEGDSVIADPPLGRCFEEIGSKKGPVAANTSPGNKDDKKHAKKRRKSSLQKSSTENSCWSGPPQNNMTRKKKGLRRAPELQMCTVVDSSLSTRIGLHRCQVCGDCFTCFCPPSEGPGPGCAWHSSLEGDSHGGAGSAGFSHGDCDDFELDMLAEECTENMLKSHKRSRREKGNAGRTKQANRVSRARRMLKEKQFRPKNVFRCPSGHPLVLVKVKHDIRRRGEEREERFKDAVVAKKENIEKRLRVLKLERRGPPKNCVSNSGGTGSPAQPTKHAKLTQHAQPVRYELRETDVSRFASTEEEAELLRVLALIQHRDLLPEDYDLLLRLDEKVAKKTVGSDRLNNLRTRLLTDKDLANTEFAGAACAICMECYHADEVAKWLPCQHVFHCDCIDQWLSEAGSICPLDGLEV